MNEPQKIDWGKLIAIGVLVFLVVSGKLQIPGVNPLSPAPIPDPGFRVLVVYESAEMTNYPVSTQAILAGAEVREFLKANCVAEDGQPGFRIYDADVNTAGDLAVWRTAMTRPRTELPWVVISNGKSGFEGPLPKTAAEFIDLCKKYLPTK